MLLPDHPERPPAGRIGQWHRAYCTDAVTGASVWRRDLGGQHYSSVVAIGDKVYLTSTQGLTTIMACDRRNRKLGECDLREPVFASFAPVDGDLFIRTKSHLYRVHEGNH